VITPQIWINGVSQPVDGLHISAADRGLTLADGLFETMRAMDGRIFRLQQHLARLVDGLTTLGIPSPPRMAQSLADALSAAGDGDARVRLTVTRGVGPGGLIPPAEARPTLIVSVSPMPAIPGRVYEDGLSAHVVAGRRNGRAMSAGLKTAAYVDAVMATIEALRHGADEALFLDTDDHCSEGAGSNLFIVIDDALVTPPLSCAALPGITRAAALEIAADAGLRAEERPFGLDDLLGADEALLTNSTRGLAPLVRVGDRAIGSGRPGPATVRLTVAYAALVERERR
jgi:branched-chain amino acid aminotransferase